MVPPPEPGDSDDVSWALSTAVAMETRRDFYECVRWLRRAAELSSEASRDQRALILAKAAAELTQQLEETTDVGEHRVEHIPTATELKAQLPKPIAHAKDASKHAAKESNKPRAPAAMRARAPSTTEEWDAMPTQALSSEDLAHIARTDETPSLSADMFSVPSSTTAPHQAIRVRVWSDGNGVHIAPVATHVSAPSVEAMLVGLDGTDLHAWISGVTAPTRR